MVHRWLYADKTEVYHIVWADKWGWFKINSDQVTAAVFYDLLAFVRTSQGCFPYAADHPDFWHVETPDSFLDYLRNHLTKKGRFKKCI